MPTPWGWNGGYTGRRGGEAIHIECRNTYNTEEPEVEEMEEEEDGEESGGDGIMNRLRLKFITMACGCRSKG